MQEYLFPLIFSQGLSPQGLLVMALLSCHKRKTKKLNENYTLRIQRVGDQKIELRIQFLDYFFFKELPLLLRFLFSKALGCYSANCTWLKGSKIYLMTTCKSFENLKGGMLLECRAVNALCAGESFPSSWPQALSSSALIMHFSLLFYRDFLLRQSITQCRHYLILRGDIHASLGGAGVIITQPIVQMGN